MVALPVLGTRSRCGDRWWNMGGRGVEVEVEVQVEKER
jgi:hypothetical protein